MIVIRGKIPIIIHPFFWISAFVLGWMAAMNMVGALVWVLIIFVSVLFHEFGHALTACFFRQKASIQLMALGGVTSYDGPRLPFWQQFLITLNGPLFGFFLFLSASWLLHAHWIRSGFVIQFLQLMRAANLFWTVINLLPIIPLDGGQLLRIGLEAAFGMKGFRASLFIGSLISVVFSLYFFVIGAFLMGALFFLFSFQAFDGWKKSRLATRNDREDEHRRQMQEGEQALSEHRLEAAEAIFQKLKDLPAGGLVSIAATQYLAFVKVKQGKNQEAYELLRLDVKSLSPEGLSLLHQLAWLQKNYALVTQLAAECYQLTPSQEVALRNARAFAALKRGREAGGWLQTAWQYGGLQKESVLSELLFQELRMDPDFKEFINRLV